MATPALEAMDRTLVPEYPFSSSESAAAWMIWSRELSVAVAPVIRMYYLTHMPGSGVGRADRFGG